MKPALYLPEEVTEFREKLEYWKLNFDPARRRLGKVESWKPSWTFEGDPYRAPLHALMGERLNSTRRTKGGFQPTFNHKNYDLNTMRHITLILYFQS